MRKLFLIFVLMMSITGCLSYKEISLDSETLASSTTTYNGSEEETTYEFNTLNNDVIMTMDEEKLNPSESLDLTAYSGNWQCLNTTAEEDGGVSLSLTISGQYFEGSLAAWSKNYNRLAETELAGALSDNSGNFYFEDDGRGNAGNVNLILENDNILMTVTFETDNMKGDFSFPQNQIKFLRKSGNNQNLEQSNAVSIESDSFFPILIDSENEKVNLYVLLDDPYKPIKDQLAEFALQKNIIWEEYTEYSVLNNKECWPMINDTGSFMKYASLMYTLIQPDFGYTLMFQTEENIISLRAAYCSSSVVASEKGVRCGDEMNIMEQAYGTNYIEYVTESKTVREYKTSKGYIRFFFDSNNNTINEWGIDKYSFDDILNSPHS